MREKLSYWRWKLFTSRRRKRVEANFCRIRDYYHHYW